MSAQKISQTLLVASLVMLAIGLVVLFVPQAASRSATIKNRRAARATPPRIRWLIKVNGTPIHARKECCRACHGGNDQAQDKETAHVGITLHPLDDTYTACHQCHPDDYRQRAEVFAVALHITPQSSEPVTQTVAFQPPSDVPPIRLPHATDRVEYAQREPVVVGVGGDRRHSWLIGVLALWRKLAHS